MGFAAGLPPRAFAPFFQSLRATDYRGQTALVISRYGQEAVSTFRQLADHVIEVHSVGSGPSPSSATVRLLRLLKQTRGLRRLYPPAFRARCALTRERDSYAFWSGLEYELEGLMALRHGYYHDFLAADHRRFDQVLVSDVRDVIFQSDPFAEPLDSLELFMEDSSHRFAIDDFNGMWLRDLEGSAFAHEHALDTPSCAGTVAGPTPALLAYLGAMRAEISWRRIPMGSHDQGVHNALILKGRLPQAKLLPNGTGRVLTMGGMTDPRFDGDGKVYCPDGSEPAVVHQYDRFPGHSPRVFARYSA
jgi:hypothetical protein